MTQLERARKL